MTDEHPQPNAFMADPYRTLFDNSGDAILIIEHDKFVDCNQAAVDMLRYEDKQAFLQCHPSELSPEYQPDGQRSIDKANWILSTIRDCGNQRFEWDHKASNGCEALATLQSLTPDLILTDVVMPEMNGPRLKREMDERGIQIPVLFLSGYDDERLALCAPELSKESLLRKPFSADELLDQVRKTLRPEVPAS